MFSKDEVIKNINGLIDSAGRTSGSLSAHYERRVDEVEAALTVLGYKVEYDEDNFYAVDIVDADGGRACSGCNLSREVAMADWSRILVCDGGCDELEQVSASDPACDKYEPRW
jgi:hypothetical protein